MIVIYIYKGIGHEQPKSDFTVRSDNNSHNSMCLLLWFSSCISHCCYCYHVIIEEILYDPGNLISVPDL